MLDFTQKWAIIDLLKGERGNYGHARKRSKIA